jgi:hypothetical protein
MSPSSKIATIVFAALACGAIALGAGVAPGAGFAAEQATGVPQITPAVITVLAPPVPVKMSDQKWWAYYELIVTNTTDWPLVLERLEVTDADDPSKVRADMANEQIAEYLRLPGGGAGPATLAAGQTCIVWMNVPFFCDAAIPEALQHTITTILQKPDGTKQETSTVFTMEVPTEVEDWNPIWLQVPPVRGKRYLVAASGALSYHRTALMALDCQWHLAQRHAFDLMLLTSDYRLTSGPPYLNESYPIYGQEVMAVRSSVVAAVHDGEPDNTPGQKPPGMTAAKAAGNYVVLDLGRGRYALYAHLIPGSIRVAPGEEVLRGQVLGLAGNSGNSDAPHLHFHIMDGPDPLKSNGLPCVFKKYTIFAEVVFPTDPDAIEEIQNGGPLPIKPTPLQRNRKLELPQDMVIVDFM